jgi:serine/threonine-protein kinase RsbT
MAPILAREPVEIRVATRAQADSVLGVARRFARTGGCSKTLAERFTLAAIELATNLSRYGRDGSLLLSIVNTTRGPALQMESRDHGPGIEDIERAMQDGFSTGGGLGSGLPSVRRLLDEMDIVSGPEGTQVVGRLWLPTT